MHGQQEGGGEGCGEGQLLVRHMWPATRVEASPPSAQGHATTAPSGSSVLPPVTILYPQSTAAPPAAAQKQERVHFPRPVSPDSFVKDGREIRVGDCALFQAVNVPPFIGLIRWIEKQKEGYPKLRVSWLYRPADVKLNKGIQLNAAPNEIFYSFHQDETSAVSLLHPCKVAFLRKGIELPAGTSSFVCWRLYDIDNKCLWWLTDRDYINERQEEVNQLLYRTTLEMHAAVQSGGRSPKGLNGPSASQQLKLGSAAAQNCGPSKGKKRDRGEQGIDPTKRDRDRSLKVDDSEPGCFKGDNMKSEVAMITEKGRLPHAEAVEKLVHLMQLDRTERKIDFAGRAMLADIIAATESSDCLGRFVQLRGLPVLDDWLQEAHKGKSGEGSSPKETDKPIEELLLALLRALAKLPINLTALQSCSIGKSVNHLRSHKNMEIQKKAKCLVDNWKKRVDVEMKLIEVKPVVPGQAIAWAGKVVFPEISNAGNRRSGSSEPSPKNPVSHLSSSKALIAKPGNADAVVKSNSVISGPSKLQHLQPANVATKLKDPFCKSSGGAELPTVKEEKSSSSSQSLNNSQSCSSDHAKTIGSSWKEDARSSTAASGNASKTSGSSSRGHRRANNGLLGSGIQKEATVGRSGSPDRLSLQEKSSQSGMASEKGGDMLSDNGNGHRLIVRFPSPGHSPARSASGGSVEDPSVTGSRSSSPVLADKHEQNDRRVKMRTENSRPQLPSDANAESWHSNEIKGAGGSEEGDKSACATLEDDRSKTSEEAGKDACTTQVVFWYSSVHGVCSSVIRRNSFNPMNALIEIKYSKTGPSLQAGDDAAMNLLASVAGEISKSELGSPSASPKNSSANEVGCEGESSGKLNEECDAVLLQHQGPLDVENVIMDKQEKNDVPLILKEERHPSTKLSAQDNKSTCTGPSPQPDTDSKAAESSAMTQNQEEEHMDMHSSLPGVDSQGEDLKAGADFVSTTLGGQCNLVVSDRKLVSLPADKLSLCSSDKQANTCEKEQQLSGKSNLKSASSSVAVDPKKAVILGVCSTVTKESEKEQQPSSTTADVSKLAVSAVFPLGAANGINEIKESKDSSSESSSHVKPGGITSQEADHSARHSSEKSSSDTCAKEGIVSSEEGSSLAAKNNLSVTKLDFDLNEGIPGDEGQQSEPTTSHVKCSIHFAGLSPFISPIAGGLPAPITVAAPAKGPFVLPENLIRVKAETGWKGSADTSAFRPAEPRKILEIPLTMPDILVSDAAGKHSRPALDIDLNVADDQVLEEDVSQCSAQTTGSESGNTRSLDGPTRSTGIELDLNRADEVSENGHRAEVPLMPVRPLPGVFSNSDRNSSRDFDLNNGPSLDEAGTEPAQRSLPARNTSGISFLPQVAAGFRMNNAEMSNISPWFASPNPCPPVAMQSFLPAREQPYPIEATPGTQRIIASAADSGQFGSDSARAPVISTSPAMVFHPPYSYAGFSFPPGVHLQTPGFSIGSVSCPNSAPSGVSYFPTITPSFVGPTGALPAQHARQYPINLPEGSNVSGHDISRKWGRQGLDLNSGPSGIDIEGKDERAPLLVRQNVITPPHTFVEQARMYQMPGVGVIKRKEPEGSWDAERSPYKQLSWQ